MATGQMAANGRGPVAAAAPEATQAEHHAELLNQVVQATEAARYSVRDVEIMAEKAARSNMYGMTDAQAFVLMMIAESEGLHPIQAMKRYHVIFNRPAMRADAMLAEFQRRGGRVIWHERTAESCRAEAWHPRLHPEHLMFSETITGLADRGVATTFEAKTQEWRLKDMYVKFPRQMLTARVVSEFVRLIDPGVIVGVYTPEEVEDFPENERVPMAWTQPEIEAPIGQGQSIIKAEKGPKGDREISACRAWIAAEIRATNDKLHSTLLLERKPTPFPDIATNPGRLAQHLVTAWIEAGAYEERVVLKDKPNKEGKYVRDPDKVAAAVQVEWDAHQDDLKEDVRQYLRVKLAEALETAGVDPGVAFDDEATTKSAEDK